MAAHRNLRSIGWLTVTVVLTVPALAQQPAFEPLSPTKCGHGHFPPCPPPPPPPPPPVTLSIAFSPPTPSIPDNLLVGTPIAQVIVTVSDGSPFTGTLGFAAPYYSGGGICAIQGSEIILGLANPPDGIQNCTITATQ